MGVLHPSKGNYESDESAQLTYEFYDTVIML